MDIYALPINTLLSEKYLLSIIQESLRTNKQYLLMNSSTSICFGDPLRKQLINHLYLILSVMLQQQVKVIISLKQNGKQKHTFYSMSIMEVLFFQMAHSSIAIEAYLFRTPIHWRCIHFFLQVKRQHILKELYIDLHTQSL